jgi:hypothetical protein
MKKFIFLEDKIIQFYKSHFINPDYALGFVMRTVSAIKSGCLETESAAADMVIPIAREKTAT